MKVGDIVQINDLCRFTDLHDAIGTVIEGPIYEEPERFPMMVVLINGEFIPFRQGDTQLEVISENH